jgi:formylglycine-generating enzyme
MKLKLSLFRFFSLRNKLFLGALFGSVLTIVAVYVAHAEMKRTSTNEYCESCHVHPHATETWKLGAHYKNKSGVVVDCIDCHLPPDGIDHVVEKAKAGIRDLYAFYFTDVDAIDWEAKSTLEAAVHFTFDVSCIGCHQELFPIGLSEEGVDGHLHYRRNPEELRCINCHLRTGHFSDKPEEMILALDEAAAAFDDIEMAPLLSELEPGEFADYTEVIPGTDVKFQMVAVPGGVFTMGSPETEIGRRDDEGPQRRVRVSPFWMGMFEVTWLEFDAYYAQTATRGTSALGEADAVTGPTPPYGSPDQGWGKGLRPAITMTHYAAQRYCEWLSEVTGHTYRLPTEAEWEYAARAGSAEPYFFQTEEGPDSWFERWLGTLFGRAVVDEETLGRYAVFRANSRLRTQVPIEKESNPLGLYNMYGNVKEFCADWYAPDVLASYPEDEIVVDPTGPETGRERVVRGGSFRSEAGDLRSAARDHTRHDAWMRTDPQTPKSVWWYSDANDVGFRVFREFRPE